MHRGTLEGPHQRDHRGGHRPERAGDDEPARQLDGQDRPQARDDDVKEAVIREIVELVLGALGRGRIGQAPRDVAEREVLRIVHAREELRDEE